MEISLDWADFYAFANWPKLGRFVSHQILPHFRNNSSFWVFMKLIFFLVLFLKKKNPVDNLNES